MTHMVFGHNWLIFAFRCGIMSLSIPSLSVYLTVNEYKTKEKEK